MMFPVPKTLLGAFSPTFLITWSLGLGVIEYPIGRPRRIISAFLSIVNFCFYLGLLRMANLSKLVTFDQSKTAARGRRINSYIAVVFIAIFICIAKINAKVVNGVFPKLTGITDRLNVLGISNGYKSVFKVQIIQFSIAMLLLSTVIILDYQLVGFEFAEKSSRIGSLISLHYSILFVFIVDCTFGSIVRYIGNRFKGLNQVLRDLNSVKTGEPMIAQRTKTQISHYPSVISETHRHGLAANRTAEKCGLLYVIRETRFVNKKLNLHRGLCKVATELNEACGIQVLLSMAWTFDSFIAILHIGYNIILAIFKHRLLPNHWMHVVNNVIWNSFFALKLLLIVDACETTSSEANRTGELISVLRNNLDGDEEFRDEINVFSLQLIQNPLEFSANGFFTLNYSLIRAMIGAVTTYLIIIIQVQSIYEPETMASTKNPTISVQSNSSNQN